VAIQSSPGPHVLAQSFRVFCPGELRFRARPPRDVIAAYIDAHRDEHGVETICAALPIAPSTHHEAKAREADPTRLPARAQWMKESVPTPSPLRPQSPRSHPYPAP